MNRKKIIKTAVSIILILPLILQPTSTKSAAETQASTPRIFDVSISLYSNPTTAEEKGNYEHIIEYFADGVYESSNGAHKIGTVKIYANQNFADQADIVWVENCHPQAQVSGRAESGLHISMCDNFSGTNFLQDDFGWQGGGYALAHEWGHYAYSLYDEYQGNKADDSVLWLPHSTDQPVPNSIMNRQWNARNGQYTWLNFSTTDNDTHQTAQFRVYAASGWETLSRPISEDPRDGERLALPERIYYPELATVGPAENQDPSIELPDPGNSRSDLEIIWVKTGITYQIIIDRSSSMEDNNKIESARIAASLLVEMAELNQTTVGVIKFNHGVEIVHSLSLLENQADKDAVKSEIESIQPSGRTAIGDAAQLALDGLLASNTQATTQAVFLLTDGISNEGVDPLSVIPAYQAAKIPLFIFGYGSDVNEFMLQQMARETKGKYYFSPTTLADLSQVFQDANQIVSPSIGVAIGSITVGTSAPVHVPIQIDSSLKGLNLVITFKGAPEEVGLSLIAPDGTNYTISDCSVSGFETLCFLSVDELRTGNWSLQATSQGSDILLSYRVSAATADQIPYSTNLTSLTGDVVQYPQPIVLLAILGKGLPIAGAVVNASVQNPDGSTSQVAMRDDGQAPDVLADDGLYSSVLDYNQNGSYNFTVEFNNSANTAHLTELSFLPSIGPDGEAIPPADPIPVTEQFMRFARIQINVVGVQPDDHGNTPPEASSLSTSNIDVPGKIDYPGDIDVFRIVADRSGELVLRISRLALGMEPCLRVLAEDESTVLVDADLVRNSSSSGYLIVELSVNGGDILYAEVSHCSDTGGGVYEISVGNRLTGEITINDQPPPSGGFGFVLLIGILAIAGVLIYSLTRRSKQVSKRGDDFEKPTLIGSSGWHMTITTQDFIIGRGTSCHLQLRGRSISRTHARIRFSHGMWFIQDMNSRSGIYINGRRVGASRLRDGDTFTIGDITITFRMRKP